MLRSLFFGAISGPRFLDQMRDVHCRPFVVLVNLVVPVQGAQLPFYLRSPRLLRFPPASLDLEYLHEVLLETPRSAQGITSDSSSHAPVPSNLLRQVTAPVDSWTSLCAVCSASTSQPPPLPPPQVAVSPPPSWRRISQKAYNRGEKQWDYTPSGFVSLGVNGQGEYLNIRDALRKRFTGLDGRDDPVLQDANNVIS